MLKSDDIFEKYDNVEHQNLKPKGRIFVDGEIDLTANCSDFHSEEATDPLDRYYKESAIVKKYNRHSTLHMRETDSSATGEKIRSAVPCSELSAQAPKSYLPLSVEKWHSVTSVRQETGGNFTSCRIDEWRT